jgi:hypothetical protein
VDVEKLKSLVEKIKRPLETARRLGARGEGVVKDLDARGVTWAREGEEAAEGGARVLFAELAGVFEETETGFAEKVALAANVIVELEVVLSEAPGGPAEPADAPKTPKKAPSPFLPAYVPGQVPLERRQYASARRRRLRRRYY